MQLTLATEVRQDLKGKDLSFVEIAKAVGKRWQLLPPEEKATRENKSQVMKDSYYAQLDKYKNTQQYADYQKYLVNFRAEHECRSSGKPKIPTPDVPI